MKKKKKKAATKWVLGSQSLWTRAGYYIFQKTAKKYMLLQVHWHVGRNETKHQGAFSAATNKDIWQKLWWRQSNCKMLSNNGHMVQNVGWKGKNPEDVSLYFFQRIHQNFQVVEEISGNREAEVLQNLWVIKKIIKNSPVRKRNPNLFGLNFV